MVMDWFNYQNSSAGRLSTYIVEHGRLVVHFPSDRLKLDKNSIENAL